MSQLNYLLQSDLGPLVTYYSVPYLSPAVYRLARGGVNHQFTHHARSSELDTTSPVYGITPTTAACPRRSDRVRTL
jgi:hypothetical protein